MSRKKKVKRKLLSVGNQNFNIGVLVPKLTPSLFVNAVKSLCIILTPNIAKSAFLSTEVWSCNSFFQ